MIKNKKAWLDTAKIRDETSLPCPHDFFKKSVKDLRVPLIYLFLMCDSCVDFSLRELEDFTLLSLLFPCFLFFFKRGFIVTSNIGR